jgi:hypothetical protein
MELYCFIEELKTDGKPDAGVTGLLTVRQYQRSKRRAGFAFGFQFN